MERTGTQQRVTTTLGTKLRAEKINIRTKNVVTTRSVVGTAKKKREKRKHESRTHLRGIEWSSSSSIRNESQTLAELSAAVLTGRRGNIFSRKTTK